MSARDIIAKTELGISIRSEGTAPGCLAQGTIGGAFADKVLGRLTDAGYRILAPGELDPETVERAASIVEANMLCEPHGDEVLHPRTNPGNKVGLAYATAIRSLQGAGK